MQSRMPVLQNLPHFFLGRCCSTSHCSAWQQCLTLSAHFSDIRASKKSGLYCATLSELKQNNPGLQKMAENEQAFTDYTLAGLAKLDERKAQELELRKNVCAARN